MKSAFIDEAGVLTAFGYLESHNEDRRVEVDDDFEMSIGLTQFAGGRWSAFVPPTPVPAQVTMRQARLALLAIGKLAAVAAAIAALPSPQKEAAEVEWGYGSVVERESPLTKLLGQALGLDDAALNTLFVQASSL